METAILGLAPEERQRLAVWFEEAVVNCSGDEPQDLSEDQREKCFAAVTWLWRIPNCWSRGTAPSNVSVHGCMSFVVRKFPLAEQGALDAATWYEERQTGLGEEFLDEVDRAVQALRDTALHHRVRFGDVRRTPRQRFNFTGFIMSSDPKRFGSSRFSTGDDIRVCCRNVRSKVSEPRNSQVRFDGQPALPIRRGVELLRPATPVSLGLPESRLSSRDMGALAGVNADKVAAAEKRDDFVAPLFNGFATAFLAIHQGEHKCDSTSFTLNRIDGLKG